MTKNSFSKSAIRARMAETGEPYSVAARALAEDAPKESATAAVADYRALIPFCERLAMLVESGNGVKKAMDLVRPYTEDKVLLEALDFVVNGGNDILVSMDLRPNAFRSIFPVVLRAHIQSGLNKASALLSMANLYRTELEMEERAAQYR